MSTNKEKECCEVCAPFTGKHDCLCHQTSECLCSDVHIRFLEGNHKRDCPCHQETQPEANYVDSRTPEEREADSKIEVTLTTTSAWPKAEKNDPEGFAKALEDFGNAVSEANKAQPEEGWEEELQEYWNSEAPDDSGYFNIRSLIKDLLTQERAKWNASIEPSLNNGLDAVIRAERARWQEELKEKIARKGRDCVYLDEIDDLLEE